jgi:O-antigen/teichoic acid export membrane protein
MSLWQRIFQGLTAFYSSTVITSISGLVQSIIVLRYLTVAEYGALVLMFSFYRTATIFLELGTGGIFNAEIAKALGGGQTAQAKGLFQLYMRLLSMTGLVLGSIFMVIGWQRQDVLWPIFGVYLFLSGLNSAFTCLFMSHTRFRRSATLDVVRSLSRLVLLVGLLFWPVVERLPAVALTYPLMELCTLVAALWMATPIRHEFRGLLPVRPNVGELVRRQGIFVMLNLPVKRTTDQLPIWALSALVGETAVAYYGAAQRAFSFVYAGFAPLETVLFPLVSEQSVQHMERLQVALRQSQKYTFWFAVAVVAVLLPVAPWVIVLIGGEEYRPAIPVFQWMLGVLLFVPFYLSYRPVMFSASLQQWLLVSNIVSLIIYTLCLWTLIPVAGAVGAAQALLLNNLLLLPIRQAVVWFYSRDYWVSPLSVFRFDEFDRRLWAKVRRYLPDGLATK